MIKTSVCCSCIILFFGIPQALGVPDDFFLTDYTTRDINSIVTASATPIQISTSVTGYDLAPGFIPLTFTGVATKPFSGRQPFYEWQTLSTCHVGRILSAGLRLAREIQTTRFSNENQDAISTDPMLFDAIALEEINHTRAGISATANLMLRAGSFLFTLAGNGQLINHAGYEFTVMRNSNYSGSDHHLYDYEPEDQSVCASGGLLISVPAKLLGCPMLNWLWINGAYSNEHLPVHTPGVVGELGSDDRFFWYGSRTDIHEGTWCIATQPLEPHDRSLESMMYRGFLIHGMRMANVSFRFNDRIFYKNNLRYSPMSGSDSTTTYAWSINYTDKTYTLDVHPEFFFTPWFSTGFLLTASEAARASISPDASLFRLSQTLDIAGSIEVNLFRSLPNGMDLAIQLSSGQITMPVSFPKHEPRNSEIHYREYLLAMSITLLGLR